MNVAVKVKVKNQKPIKMREKNTYTNTRPQISRGMVQSLYNYILHVQKKNSYTLNNKFRHPP